MPADAVPYEFTDWLRHHLTRRGWTQAQLAEKLGVSEAHVSRYANRDRRITPDKAALLSQLFNVSLVEVYENAGLPIPTDDEPPPTTGAVIEADRRLTKEQKELLLGILRSWVPDA